MKQQSVAKPPLQLTLMEVAVLLYNLHKAASIAEVGYEDCEISLSDLTKMLTRRRLPVDQHLVERALWSCVMLDEHAALTDGFLSPDGKSLTTFIREIEEKTDGLHFDPNYCFFK